jgi:2-oxoglutarate dehydrogenase E1 component
VAQVVDLAMDFRQKFSRDVVIDMYCFRRWGHNEGDEPSFHAAPALRGHRAPGYGPLRVSAATVIAGRSYGGGGRADCRRNVTSTWKKSLLWLIAVTSVREQQSLGGFWSGYAGGSEPADDDPSTGVQRTSSEIPARTSDSIPRRFPSYTANYRSDGNAVRWGAAARPLDWAAAEALAFRHVGDGRPSRSAHGTRCRARNVQSSACGAARRRGWT